MMKEMGYCSGIENYSRYLSGRNPGEPPPCLLDYMPKDGLVIIDESHVGVPQMGGMFRGRSIKESKHWLTMVLDYPLQWIIVH